MNNPNKMFKIAQIILALFIFISCTKDEVDTPISEEEDVNFISAADISQYPEISNSHPLFYDLNGTEKDFLNILKENGINTIRLKLWVHPNEGHSGFDEVNDFSKVLKSKGFKIWLSLHYSDTWADPSAQETPEQWQGISFEALKDSVFNYTIMVTNEIKPDYIQIGNEINSGFLFPSGHISDHYQQFIGLMKMAISAVRSNSIDTKIILHYAGIEGSERFFDRVSTLDYDIIGLSYYPIWHGKSLNNLKTKMQDLSEAYHKKVLIAETAYPFTLEWNDWTNNIVGLEEQLILPEYPATPEGQATFFKQIISLTKAVQNGIGVCYWGGELISWKGSQSTEGSSWENQALFDFHHKALPILKEFNNK